LELLRRATSATEVAPVTSVSVDADDGVEEDEPVFPWLPPDDRLWRHPSEVAIGRVENGTAVATKDPDRRLWAVALLAGMVGALLTSGAGVVSGQYRHSTTVVRPIEQLVDPGTPYVTIAANARSDIADIADRLRPSLVELLVDNNGASGTGSGVIFRSDGYILTNSHVVDGAHSVVAVLSDGHRVTCRLIGSDHSTDIAVVKLQGTKQQTVAVLGSSNQLRVGQLAIAIGSPLGLAGGPSVTSGIISGVDRQVNSGEGGPFVDMIQTDAAIEPGSSGGALVDANGMVIGITTAVAFGDQSLQSMGFATPIEVARDVADQLLSTGKVTHAWLGIQGSDVDGATAKALGITGGAIVSSVESRSPASQSGIGASDIVTAFGGQPVNTMNALAVSVRQHRPGDRMNLTYIHDGAVHATEIVLEQRPISDYP